MENLERAHINQHLGSLTDDTIVNESVLTDARQEDLIAQEEVERIRGMRTNKEKAVLFYEIIQTREGAYPTILRILHRRHQTGAARILKQLTVEQQAQNHQFENSFSVINESLGSTQGTSARYEPHTDSVSDPLLHTNAANDVENNEAHDANYERPSNIQSEDMSLSPAGIPLRPTHWDTHSQYLFQSLRCPKQGLRRKIFRNVKVALAITFIGVICLTVGIVISKSSWRTETQTNPLPTATSSELQVPSHTPIVNDSNSEDLRVPAPGSLNENDMAGGMVVVNEPIDQLPSDALAPSTDTTITPSVTSTEPQLPSNTSKRHDYLHSQRLFTTLENISDTSNINFFCNPTTKKTVIFDVQNYLSWKKSLQAYNISCAARVHYLVIRGFLPLDVLYEILIQFTKLATLTLEGRSMCHTSAGSYQLIQSMAQITFKSLTTFTIVGLNDPDTGCKDLLRFVGEKLRFSNFKALIAQDISVTQKNKAEFRNIFQKIHNSLQTLALTNIDLQEHIFDTDTVKSFRNLKTLTFDVKNQNSEIAFKSLVGVLGKVDGRKIEEFRSNIYIREQQISEVFGPLSKNSGLVFDVIVLLRESRNELNVSFVSTVLHGTGNCTLRLISDSPQKSFNVNGIDYIPLQLNLKILANFIINFVVLKDAEFSCKYANTSYSNRSTLIMVETNYTRCPNSIGATSLPLAD